ncbi:KGG domain-containing protein [Massilia alkalitolerans]|uniref:KGG domain-containing protein n=1 Tax=Massilia alkalitolerans TaxID=286638 RepID=UPI0028B061AA|nr:KGG domain-containing protein [Massilia alkalitolerans]
MASNNQGNSKRGFASMDPQRQHEIASQGGRAAHASGNAHEFTSEEAREAGRMSHKNDGNQQSGNRGNPQSGGNGGERGGNR